MYGNLSLRLRKRLKTNRTIILTIHRKRDIHQIISIFGGMRKLFTVILPMIVFLPILALATGYALAAPTDNITTSESNVSTPPTMSIIEGTTITGQQTETSADNTTTNDDAASSTSNQTGSNIIPTPLLDIAPSQRIALAFSISFGATLIIILVARRLIRYAKRSHPNIKTGFWDIIREQDWYPSLAIFQFLVWTFVIIFAFLGIYLFRIFGGVLEAPPSVPTNILALMGISVGVPIVSGGISRIRYFSSATTVKEPPTPLPPLSTMLEENNKPALTRFQMFGWTWIGTLIYIVILFSTVGTTLTDIVVDASTCQALQPNEAENSQLRRDKSLTCLTLPDIDPTLVVLMGLSQGAYLGGKIITTPTMTIDKVALAKKDTNKYVLSIFGINFGSNPDTVWVDDTQIRGDDLLVWEDSRIDASFTKPLQQGQTFKVRIAKGSLTAEKIYELGANHELKEVKVAKT